MILLYQFGQRLAEGQLEEWISSSSKQCLLTRLQHCYSQFGHGRVDGFSLKSDGENRMETRNDKSPNNQSYFARQDGKWPAHQTSFNIANLVRQSSLQYFKDDQQFLEHDYEKCAGTMIDDESVKNSTEVTVNEITKQFVGCVVDFGFFKVFISSFDTLVHLGDSVDDCANRIVTKEPYIFSKIREKPNYKSSSYEISIYTGSLELLAIGGVVVNTNMASSFLGSSVKPLLAIMSHGKETVSRDIYVKKTSAEVITSERLLRQYYKVHAAKKKWCFHMKNFADLGFCPLNPLRVDEHTLANGDDSALACQSIVFKAYKSHISE